MKKLLFFFILCLNISVCFAEDIDVFKLVEDGTPEQLKSALKSGAKFNVKRSIYNFDDYSQENIEDWLFSSNETPLHRAAAYNHNPESIKFLIDQGLDVNAIGENGNYASENPLACALWYKNTAAVKELLKAGADPNAWTEGGYNFVGTPCHIVAFEYGDHPFWAIDVITAIVQAGGSVNNHKELSKERLRELSENEPDFGENNTIFLPRDQWTSDEPFFNMTGFFSHYAMGNFLATFTPLMWAVIYDNKNIVDIFLDFNADVNLLSVENKSAFDYANDLPPNSKIKKSSTFKRLQLAAAHKKLERPQRK